jgi:opacity protein-like surface antigen
MRNLTSVALAAAMIASLLGPQAVAQQQPPQQQAQMMQPALMNYGKFYGGLEAGVIIPDDLSLNASGVIGGVASTLSGNLTFNAGPSVGLILGYNLNDYFAAEGNFFYGGFDTDKFNATLTGFAAGSFSLSVNGHVDTETFLANAIWRPLGRSNFTPYIGAGLGFTNFDVTINSLSGGGATAAVNSSSSEADLAVDALVGFDWTATDHWTLGGRYRFLWVNTSSVGSGGGIAASSGNFTAHVLTANATYHF